MNCRENELAMPRDWGEDRLLRAQGGEGFDLMFEPELN